MARADDTATVGSLVIDYPPPRGGGRPGPNAAQADAHRIEVDELLYGGAAGGGKTDFLIADAIDHALEFPGASIAMFRRTYPQLNELGGITYRLLDRLPQPQVARWNGTEHLWTFRNGSRLKLAHCQRDADVTKYQGAEWSKLLFDQVEQFTEFQYTYLLHRLRVSGPVADAMTAAGYRPNAVSSANPGGVGHGWVKRRWIDPYPLGRQPFRPAPTIDEPSPGVRCFVPATLDDNEANVDPTYRRRLEALPPDERRAMLLGDWNVYTGQRFREFTTAIHVIDPEELPLGLGGIPRAIGIDYGLDAPYCALWGARLADDLIVVYREDYRAGLTPAQQARRILDAEAPGERTPSRPVPAYLDPSTWARNPDKVAQAPAVRKATSPAAPPAGSIADTYRRNGVPVRKANNDRLAGVADVAARLRVRGDGRPRLLIYSTCANLIRTLPELSRDLRRPEDVDTHGEDHAYDALRYLLAGLGNRGHAEPPAGPAGPQPRQPAPPARPTVKAATAGLHRKRF